MKFDYDEFIDSIKDLSEEDQHICCQKEVYNAEYLLNNVYIGQRRKNNPDEVSQLKFYISSLKKFIWDNKLY